ncbi:MAG: helix-turn-helix transcriptional regulator [Chloroflexota bacterium]
MEQEPTTDPVEAIAALAEPTRRALYDLVSGSDEPVGRDDAVTALGISRELAAFHLDRLVAAGLLKPEYRRRSGRTGPGAGRPAKLYRRTDEALEISLPPRHYDRAADLMAIALRRVANGAGLEALAWTARDAGAALGAAARGRIVDETAGMPAAPRLVEVLDDAGYEPLVEPDGTVCLRNCPYGAVAADHRDVTCGMNLAWAEGVVDGIGIADVQVELAPEPGRCCVVFHGEMERLPDAG